MLRFAQHDNRGVITCHAERSKAESKHLRSPMPNVHWITVVYLDDFQRPRACWSRSFFLR